MSSLRLFLVDGSSFIFRAYYALPPLSNRKGEPTGAVYGFTQMLLKTLRDGNATHIAVAFDTSEPTFRHNIYKEYKANRKAPPDDLKPQFSRIREVVEAFNLPVISIPGWEADDLMGTLATKARDAGFEVVLVTGDKDFMQLVGPGIRMYDGMRDRWFDENEVVSRFGVPPELVPDAMALIGDTSDNIPGVRGIGEKTAGPLISRFGSLESLLENIESLQSKSQVKKLTEGRESAILSKKLVKIDVNAPVELEKESLKLKEPDYRVLRQLFADLDFTALLKETGTGEKASQDDYRIVLSSDDLNDLCRELSEAKAFSVDTETTDLSAMKAKLVGLSFSTGEGKAWYIPTGHIAGDHSQQLPEKNVLEALRGFLEDPKKSRYVQNTKYDYLVLKNHGINLGSVAGDPMLLDYLLDPGKGGHGLDALSETELGFSKISFQDVAGKGKEQITFDKVPVEKAGPYACEDADFTFRLAEKFLPAVKEAGLWNLYQEMEQPLSFVLAEMEHAGFRVEKDILSEISVDLGNKIDYLKEEIYLLAGKEFSINSPKQLAAVLFEDMGLKVVKRTKTGPSTDVSVLEQLALKHDLPVKILEYRHLTKLKNTYVDTLPSLVNSATGRIHTSFSQTTAATGRLSSSDPNLQNIPIRSPEGRKIREAFSAEEGNLLVSADYSQIELRVLAHLAGDDALRESFERGEDIHARTASELLGVSLDEVGSEHRRIAKAINFGILYGMGAFRLARELRIPRDKADQYIRGYFERYKAVAKWLEKSVAEARENKMVRTISGRIRKLPDLDSKNFNVRTGAERIALNTPIQGSAADIIKTAMLKVHENLPEISPGSRMILQVHDELILETPEADAQLVGEWLCRLMENAVKISVPLKVDMGIGRNWALAH